MTPAPRTVGPLLLLWICVLWAAPVEAEGDSWFGVDLSFRLSNRFNWKANFLNTEGGLAAASAHGLFGQGRPTTTASDPLNLRFDKGELGYSVLAGGSLGLRFGSAASLRLAMDSGEVKFPGLVVYEPAPACRGGDTDPRCQVTSNGRTILDEAERSYFVREAFLRLDLGSDDWLAIRAGKMLLSTGNGFVMDNYALGLALEADLDAGFSLPLRIELDAVLPDGSFDAVGKQSPFLYLDLAWTMTFFEEIGLFAAWYHDGDDSLAQIMASVLGEAALNSKTSAGRILYEVLGAADTTVRSRGDLFWIGLRANRAFSRVSLSATAILEFGRFDFSVAGTQPNSGDAFSLKHAPSCVGGLVDLNAHYDLTDDLTVGAFFLFLSGETFSAGQVGDGLSDRYTSFISVFPYITRLNIFFSGGMNQNFSARTFSPAGVNGRGVITPGLTAGWSLTDGLVLRLTSAALFSHGAHLTSRERFYGWETDLNLRWALGRHVALSLEADHFWTGPFFDFEKPLEAVDPRDRRFEQEPDAFKVLVGLDVLY